VNTISNILIFIYVLSFGIFDNSTFINFFYVCNIFIFAFFTLKIFFLSEKTIFKVNKVVISYVIFTCYAFLSTLWSINPEMAFERSVTLLLISFNIFYFYNFASSKDGLKYALWGVVAISLVNSLVSFNFFPFSYDNLWNNYRYQGLSINSNLLAIYVSTSIVASYMLLSFKLAPYQLFALFLNLFSTHYVVFITLSRKGLFLAFLFSLFFFIKYYSTIKKSNQKINTLMVLPITLLILLFAFSTLATQIQFDFFSIQERLRDRMLSLIYLDDGSAIYRLYYFRQGLDIFFENPLFGIGINQYQVVIGDYSHSNLIEMLSCLGLVGFVSYYSLHVNLIMELKNFKSEKFIFFSIILSFIALDIGLVSYYLKYYILFLLILSIYLEKKENNELEV